MVHRERAGSDDSRPSLSSTDNNFATGSSTSATTPSTNTTVLNSPIRRRFAELRMSLEEVETREDMIQALSEFVESLPPFYAAAAGHHAEMQKRQGIPVNIDSLAAYFSKLEQASVPPEHRHMQQHTPPGSATANGWSRTTTSDPMTIKKPPHDVADSRAPLPTDPDSSPPNFIDFAPARPQLSNLLRSESRDKVPRRDSE
ncbi:hypothetical protein Q8F55_003829 [Vanrija albida]|uniref:Uncharacterized protein n=1 Tax=Vanrija albida TaxID=181172 RepID=A0ABR3Q534_9TREE